MEAGFYIYRIGTTVERRKGATRNQKEFVSALSRSASGELLPSRQRPIIEADEEGSASTLISLTGGVRYLKLLGLSVE